VQEEIDVLCPESVGKENTYTCRGRGVLNTSGLLSYVQAGWKGEEVPKARFSVLSDKYQKKITFFNTSLILKYDYQL